MTGIVKQQMFVKTDVNANNNKFWEVTLYADGRVQSRNGRVGASGQTNNLGMGGETLYERKVREKIRGGYKEVDLATTAPVAASGSNVSLMAAAREQIARGNAIIADLVDKLTRINRHQILAASGGQMDINLDSGIVQTPVGVVTADNVQAARRLLPVFQDFVQRADFDDPRFIGAVQDYLMLVPQKVDARRGWHHTFLPDTDALVRQNALLDQLEASIEVARKAVDDAAKAAAGETPKVFDVSMTLLEDDRTWKRICDFYKASMNMRHSCAHLKPKRAFTVEISSMRQAWDGDGAALTNQRELWHGTRAHNLLSILKGGLIIPRSGGSISVTGRMFGDGLYFSDQSTKSLNYAYGFWDRGGRDDTCYMFLADVAMGREYHPRSPFSGRPPQGYDSTFVRGGTANVLNNEMIVYRTGQANLKYLIEFA